MAIVLGPGEGRRLEARGSELLFKALGSMTGGRFSFMERTVPPGGRMPPAHRHPTTVEAFFVLDGALTLLIDAERIYASAGTFILVPEGASHTFGNAGSTPARVLIIHAPALDPYFEDLARLWAGPGAPEPEAELALMRRHGLEPVEPSSSTR
ncbi:MAG: cupin domain-containing protein [Candidatus Limnocylindrales bacterium]